MFNVVFYEKENGESELWNFLEALRLSSPTNKDSRIQYRQIILHIQMLEDNGTRLPEIITKHLDEDIWELRPGNNRVLYTFSAVRIHLSFFIISAKRQKRLHAVKLRRQNVNAMTI